VNRAFDRNASRPAERVRAQVAEGWRQLSETVAALHDKTDVKGRAREKAAEAETAVSDLASRAGRKATAGARFSRWAAALVVDQMLRRAPRLVRRQLEARVRLLSWGIRLVFAALSVRRGYRRLRRRRVDSR